MEKLLQFLLTAEGSKYIIIGITALAVTMLALAVVSAHFRYTRANSPWERLARRTGLSLLPGRLLFPQRTASINGDYQGRPLKMTWTGRYVSGSTSYYTIIRRPVNNQYGHLHFFPTNVFSRVADALGRGDIKIDDAEFDRRINIIGDESVARHVFADPDLRYRILGMKKWDQINISSGELTMRLYGVVRDIDRLQGMFDLTGVLADAFDQAA